MRNPTLAYGNARLDIPAAWRSWPLLDPAAESLPPAADPTERLLAALRSPVGMSRAALDGLLDAGPSVAFVVPDATRRCGLSAFLPGLIREFTARGVSCSDMKIVFALGIHRPMSRGEMEGLAGHTTAERIELLQSDVSRLEDFIDLGRTRRGTPIELFREVALADLRVAIGPISWHYFAGFGGGRKLLMPGVASRASCQGNHLQGVDLARGERRDAARVGRLDGNPVHEDAVEAARRAGETLGVNVLLDGRGEPAEFIAGDLVEAHREACRRFARRASVPVPGGAPRRVVIVSSGGYPYDGNLVQAHKGLDMAALACAPGGVIVWIAECREGFGSDVLERNAVEPGGVERLSEILRAAYHSHAQTAHALRLKTRRHRVWMLTSLPEAAVRAMDAEPIRSLEEAAARLAREGWIGGDSDAGGLILPRGSACLPALESPSANDARNASAGSPY